jgi:hypothetical protein
MDRVKQSYIYCGKGVKMASRATTRGNYNLSDPVNSFTDVVRRIVLQPTAFFASIPRSGNIVNPLVFALICIEISVILVGLLNLIGLPGGALWLAAPQGNQGFFAFVGALVLAPIAGAVGLLITALITHLLVGLVVGPSNSGFEATFRVASYTSVTSLLGWLPYIGWLFTLYRVYLAIVGIREVHSTTTGKAALVVLIPFAVIALLVFLLVGVAGALFFRAL